MTPKHVQRTYEKYGEQDPFYAVLSVDGKEGNGWEPGEFFATGREEIGEAMAHLEKLDVAVPRGRALDFGCGVGRLTQALCAEFEEVVGLDISNSMVDTAREHNQFGERCQYRVNTAEDLALFEDASFDFVYSNIALQHNPPEAALAYIAEFCRVLRPGGVTLFQIPSGARHEPGSIGARIYSFRRGPLRRLWKRVRGLPTVEMHYVHHSLVEEVLTRSGARLVDRSQFGSVHRHRVSLRYCAVR